MASRGVAPGLAVANGLEIGGVGSLAAEPVGGGVGAADGAAETVGVGSGVGADETTTVGAAEGVGCASSILTLASRDNGATGAAETATVGAADGAAETVGVGSGVGADETTTVGAAEGVGCASSILTLASRDNGATGAAAAATVGAAEGVGRAWSVLTLASGDGDASGLAAGAVGSVAAAVGVDVGAAAIFVDIGLAIDGAPSARLAIEFRRDRRRRRQSPDEDARPGGNHRQRRQRGDRHRREASARGGGRGGLAGASRRNCGRFGAARRLPPLQFEPRTLRLAQSADRDDQRLHVGAKTLVGQPGRVASREPLQRVGELLRPRHLRAVDQHRDDVLAQALRGFDLDPNPVVGIVEPAAAVDVDDIGPAPADDSEKDVALLDAGRQFLSEIAAGRDIVDVDENALARERRFELVVEPPCGGLILAASVIDENALAHRRRSRG